MTLDRSRFGGAALLVSLLAAGCVAPSLNVGYWPAPVKTDLGDAEPRRVEVRPFADRRPVTEGVGVARGGFGNRMGTYRPDRPVPDVVRGAVTEVLRINGHSTERPPDLVLAGDVTQFWSDQDSIMSWTPPFPIPIAFEFSASVVFTVSAMDPASGALLTSRTYRGHYFERTRDRGDMLVKRALNEALGRAMREFATDWEMRDVLKRAGQR